METKTIKVPVKLELDIEVETVKKVTLKEKKVVQEEPIPTRRPKKVKRSWRGRGRNPAARAEATYAIDRLFEGRVRVRANEAYRELEAEGIAKSTIARTKLQLGIKSRYEDGCYWWVR